jgi:hypothetical protein
MPWWFMGVVLRSLGCGDSDCTEEARACEAAPEGFVVAGPSADAAT